MGNGEILRMMAEVVAEYQNCVMEVMMGDGTAIAHLIPLDQWEDEEDEDRID